MATDNIYSLACIRCKRQKVKCDRSLPHCRNCQKASHDCVYPAAAHRPGPKPGTSRRRPRESGNGCSYGGHDYAGCVPVQKHLQGHGASASPRLAFDHDDRTSSGDPTKEQLLRRIDFHRPETSSFSRSPPVYGQSDDILAQTLDLMGVSWHECEQLLELYFDNMTNLSLFHKPSFRQKLRSMSSMTHLETLLTTMFAFARRFVTGAALPYCNVNSVPGLLQRACDLSEKSVKECGDDPTPLHILQSMVLITHLKLAQGVQSVAWRMAGACVRIAYDLELHLEDAASDPSYVFYCKENDPSAQGVVEREERRRAWWAVWEADTFASGMRRLPLTINWHINKVYLPSCDEDWFAGRASQSCFLSPEPVQRWRNLADCKVKSPKAWMILMYAFKHDAFLLSNLPAQAPMVEGAPHWPIYPAEDVERGGKAREMRALIENCVQCALMAMPSKFLFEDRYLSFGTATGQESRATKELDSARHTIHLVGQLITFILYRRDVYIDAHEKGKFRESRPIPSNKLEARNGMTPASATAHAAWERYIGAAAAVSSMARNCCPTHYKFVNPWLANVMWYAAAAQVVTGLFGPSCINRQLTASNFDLIKSNIAKFVEFWGVPATLVHNLESLGARFEQLAGDQTSGLYQNSGRQAADKDAVLIATRMASLTAPAAGHAARAPTPSPCAASMTDNLPALSESSMQPDAFQSLSTEDFLNDMLNSNTWDNVDFSLDNMFLEPF